LSTISWTLDERLEVERVNVWRPSARFWLTAVVGTILWTLDERLNPEVERANVWFGWYWLTAVAGHGSICCGKIWLR
jgi:hypothetical protein